MESESNIPGTTARFNPVLIKRCSRMADTSVPTFSTASAAWFEGRRRCIKPGTADSYGDALGPLTRFFGDKPINEIAIVHLRMYQHIRIDRVCAHTVNRELGVLQQVLREFNEWKRLESCYRQLKQLPSRAVHSLTEEEAQRLLEVAFSRPKWLLAAHCIRIMLSASLGFGELRQFKRRDVDMVLGCVTVREGAKNTFRQRTIPLNDVAMESMTWILERWKTNGGGFDGEHYILPRRPRGNSALQWVLSEPTTSMNPAFCGIRKAACLPHWSIYDRRAQAISDQMVSPQLDDGSRHRGTGNLICFPAGGGAA